MWALILLLLCELSFFSFLRCVSFTLDVDFFIWPHKDFVGVSASRFQFVMYFLAASLSYFVVFNVLTLLRIFLTRQTSKQEQCQKRSGLF